MNKATVQLVGLQRNYLRLCSGLPESSFLLCIWGHEASKKLCHMAGARRGGRELDQIKDLRVDVP